MSIKAWVDGTAHAFSDDTNVLDRFVWMHEKQVRATVRQGARAGAGRARAKERAKRRRRPARMPRRPARRRWGAPQQALRSRRFADARITDMLGPSRLIDSFKMDTASLMPLHLMGMGGEAEAAGTLE